ncbi:lipid II flippase Amj family protein [Aceticella autotrophica]|uniref:Lipid II flippase Amj n=1 Tax=Aceticella autotrophica TaxID=2755338 RepID=A0A975AWZ7_9THEO|nr:lipid II flippase Amj family protein [Aceticella autotrophica]MDI6605061.1 lipid II flippase Amj family protein [Thermoanaerobacteraceae bacterium]QSZ28005.1 lipid II flippase Amj family protein [Aceticella autotrophica]
MIDAKRLLIVCFFTVIINLVDTLSYSIRPSGVMTRKLAVALSLFNIMAVMSRLSNMVQAPFLGSLVDLAIKTEKVHLLGTDMRFVLMSATLGALIGAPLMPTFVSLFTVAINGMEDAGTVPKLIIQLFRWKNFKNLRKKIVLPRLSMLKGIWEADIPKSFLIYNVIITSIYTTGIVSSLYAGAIIPEYRITASQLSGIVNGFATILLTVIVDPVAALITDQALNGKKTQNDVNKMVILLVFGKILGTLLAQLVFIPAAYIILYATKLIV